MASGNVPQIPTIIGLQEGRPEHRPLEAPAFFRHRDLLDACASAKVMLQQELVNLIHYLHFSDRSLFALLLHPHRDEWLLIKVHPEPCLHHTLTCRWGDSYAHYRLASYRLAYLVVPHDRFVVVVPVQKIDDGEGVFSLPLPETAYVLNQRCAQRFECRDIAAELVQNGVIAHGELVDFSSRAFRININPATFRIKSWFNPDIPAWVRLFSGRETFFCGSCRCIRRQENGLAGDIALAAAEERAVRFQPRKIRNPRRQITPALSAVFEHPLVGRKIQRNICDLSTTGFSISDHSEESVLMPGMIIPNLSILHMGMTVAFCTVQVIYRRALENQVHYGVGILDMSIHSYSRINHILGVHADPHVCVSSEVDMEALWEFFFQTGFIYPKKYHAFQAQRKHYIETYRKLYQDSPDVARHITYEENGKIYGHMSMVRAYERTWLIQHHAARPMMGNRLPGYVILRHMILFLHGAYTLPSAKMDYVTCFYRPDNKFPERVFGGFARDLNNPRRCSLDLFAYLTIDPKEPSSPLPKGWMLRRISFAEAWDLENFYRHQSGGMFIDVLKRAPDPGETSLCETSRQHGFMREWFLFGLFQAGRMICAMIVNRSDFGVNLSELLNSITVMVLEQDSLETDVLFSALHQLAAVYDIDKVPVLIYPDAYAGNKGLAREKQYNMWITDMQHSNLFLEFVQKKFRMSYE